MAGSRFWRNGLGEVGHNNMMQERCNDVTMLYVRCTYDLRAMGVQQAAAAVDTVTEVLVWVNMLHAPSIESLYHLGATTPYLAKSEICHFVKAS